MAMKDFVKKFAETNNMKQTQAKEIIEKVLDGVFESAVDEGSFRTAFGTFMLKETKPRAAREGRNPQTGEKIKIAAIPAQKKIVFKMSKSYKESLNS